MCCAIVASVVDTLDVGAARGEARTQAQRDDMPQQRPDGTLEVPRPARMTGVIWNKGPHEARRVRKSLLGP